MRSDPRVEVRPSVLAGGAALLLALGAGAGYVLFAARHSPAAPSILTPMPTTAAAALPNTAATSSGQVVIPLSAEARARAGIALTTVAAGALTGARKVPAVVEPNAYRRVSVTALAAGRVTRVVSELGERVTKGQVIAEMFSPALAEAQAGYVSARAELEAHDRELARVDKLVALGSASRQELERVTAEHAARRTAVQSAAAGLRLLGVTDEAMEHLGAGHAAPEATLLVRAPLAGVVTERPANVGVNVDASTSLATIVDLSSVWVVMDIYETDFSRIRVGMPAVVTTSAYPGLALTGRVSYIDPSVSPETRTAKARVEVSNPRQELRLGMLAEVSLGTDGGESQALLVPRSAVQTIGTRNVVYVANPSSDRELLERTVRLGEASGDRIVVLEGLEPGEQVVTEGSFYVRAERERLGLGDPAGQGGPQLARIAVTKDGFTPSRITLRAGTPARLTFIRSTDETCAKEVVVPSLKIKRPLPLNQPVDIDLPAQRAGTIEFICGMAMLKGTVVVE